MYLFTLFRSLSWKLTSNRPPNTKEKDFYLTRKCFCFFWRGGGSVQCFKTELPNPKLHVIRARPTAQRSVSLPNLEGNQSEFSYLLRLSTVLSTPNPQGLSVLTPPSLEQGRGAGGEGQEEHTFVSTRDIYQIKGLGTRLTCMRRKAQRYDKM